MRNTVEQGGQPQPKPVSLERRRFLQGAVVGGLTVFGYFDGSNAQQELKKVRAEAEEELKQQGIVPPTEEEIEDAWNKRNYGTEVMKGTAKPISREEAEKNLDEAQATIKRVREHEVQVNDLVFRKAPFLTIRNGLDTLAMGGGAIKLGIEVFKALRRK